MVIDLVKHCGLFFDLQKYNPIIQEFSTRFEYNRPGEEYDFKNRKISAWFNPKNVRNLGLSRTYPKMDPVQYRPEYCLLMHCSNYLGLFLMHHLYSNNKDIVFEDLGAGLGWLYVYLKALGFSKFHTIDDFSQLSEQACREFSEYAELSVVFNDTNVVPIVSNNVGVPAYPVRTISNSTQLIVCYTNRTHEASLKNSASTLGFTFLCRDSDDLAVAYCRADLHDTFTSILKDFQ